MTQTVRLRYLRMTPRKVRAVASLIRGLSVNEAEAQLVLIRKRAAHPILKLLRSGINAAETTKRLRADELKIEAIQVDGGPMLKRYLPRARGVASPIQKKMCHITLVLGELAEKKEGRFKIVVPKKSKKTEDKTKKRKTKDIKEEGENKEEKGATKKPGFFRRRFSRKAV